MASTHFSSGAGPVWTEAAELHVPGRPIRTVFSGQLYDVREVRGNQSRVFWVPQQADSADSIGPSYEAPMMLDHSERALRPAAVPATPVTEFCRQQPVSGGVSVLLNGRHPPRTPTGQPLIAILARGPRL
jgi:hypothetical protein